MDNKTPAVRMRNITKTFGPVVANDKVWLDIYRGEILALLGENGSGKTTLLRTVNRLVQPTEGTVYVNGDDVRTQDPVKLRRSIGYVLQNAGLLPHKTVADNIASVLRLNKVPKNEAKERAAHTADLVGLSPEMLNRYPSQLSGGQQQRAAAQGRGPQDCARQPLQRCRPHLMYRNAISGASISLSTSLALHIGG